MGDIIAVMDGLWFHQIILFSASTAAAATPLISKTLKQTLPEFLTDSDSLTRNSSSSWNSSYSSTHNDTEDISPFTSLLLPSPQPQLSSDSPPSLPPLHLDCVNDDKEQKGCCGLKKERPTRVNKIKSRARSHSSTPLTFDNNKHEKYRRRNQQTIYNRATLQKSMSCRSLGDLELEEVKGFMDLGFIFEKEHLNPRMLSLIPGLQRLGCYYDNSKSSAFETNHTPTTTSTELIENCNFYDEFKEEEEEKRGVNVIRPYLSEAWLIRKPNSPLLNLRLPRVTAAADMKKHLRFWARTVASEIKHES